MERKIGETFEYEGKVFEVKETSHGCNGCFLQEKPCVELTEIVGICGATERTDKKNVVFVEVQEQSQEFAQPQEQAEQPQKLNLCEVLKHCPQGEIFWSPMLGDVKYYGIDVVNEQVGVNVASGEMWDINADGTITINCVTSPEVMLYPSKEQRDWTKVKYEPKKELPRTWGKFCEQNPITNLEYFIDESSEVRKAKIEGGIRHKEYDGNVLPSKQAAEAHFALMQLHQLRDAWREGWVPDWTDGNQKKYTIISLDGEICTRIHYTIRHFLAFQDEKRADEFMDCFIDLIKQAGDLI